MPELHLHTIAQDFITFGGNVTLTEMIDILQKGSKNDGFEYCKLVADHIDLVANVPVRNVRMLHKLSCFSCSLIYF